MVHDVCKYFSSHHSTPLFFHISVDKHKLELMMSRITSVSLYSLTSSYPLKSASILFSSICDLIFCSILCSFLQTIFPILEDCQHFYIVSLQTNCSQPCPLQPLSQCQSSQQDLHTGPMDGTVHQWITTLISQSPQQWSTHLLKLLMDMMLLHSKDIHPTWVKSSPGHWVKGSWILSTKSKEDLESFWWQVVTT